MRLGRKPSPYNSMPGEQWHSSDSAILSFVDLTCLLGCGTSQILLLLDDSFI